MLFGWFVGVLRMLGLFSVFVSLLGLYLFSCCIVNVFDLGLVSG